MLFPSCVAPTSRLALRALLISAGLKARHKQIEFAR